MAVCNSPLIFLLLVSFFAVSSHGVVTFSSLQRTLIVNASPSHDGQVLKAGEDNITLTWRFNTTFIDDSNYKTIKLKLCYAPVSQQDRAWRKTSDDLQKDKTCQFKILTTPYVGTGTGSFLWKVDDEVPTATYFVRAYVHDSSDRQVGYGQSTDSHKTTNLFGIRGVSGRHLSLDIASVCFSVFSVASLFGFFFWEKKKTQNLK